MFSELARNVFRISSSSSTKLDQIRERRTLFKIFDFSRWKESKILSIFCKKIFFSCVQKLFVLFCKELKDLFCTLHIRFLKMRVGAGLQITLNGKKTQKKAISHFRARFETTFTLKPIVGHIFKIHDDSKGKSKLQRVYRVWSPNLDKLL
jgi:hypothetical protein